MNNDLVEFAENHSELFMNVTRDLLKRKRINKELDIKSSPKEIAKELIKVLKIERLSNNQLEARYGLRDTLGGRFICYTYLIKENNSLDLISEEKIVC